MKTILGITYRIKSIHHFGYIIENVSNKSDIRRISRLGWEQADETIS